jgi:hypothetical protein
MLNTDRRIAVVEAGTLTHAESDRVTTTTYRRRKV